MNIKIIIPEENKDKYLKCSTPYNGYIGNSLLFWGKNHSGYYSDINKCHLYTKEEVKSDDGNRGEVFIKLIDLEQYLTPQAEHASKLLNNEGNN